MAQADDIEPDEDFVEEDEELQDAVGEEDVADLDLETFEDDAEVVVPVEEVEEEVAEVDLDEDEEETPVEDEDEESLDVLLAREKATDDDDLTRLEEPREGLVFTATPISADEFTCRSCFLVKNRAQLADAEELICLDCA